MAVRQRGNPLWVLLYPVLYTMKLVSPVFKLFLLILRPLLKILLDIIERCVDYFIQRDNPPSKNIFLHGEFGPVDKEMLASDLPVKGTIPRDLDGEFVRNGPNPRFIPRGGYHWFDGDGMLHGVRVREGRLTYVNRYVRTSKLATDEKLGRNAFLTIGDLNSRFGLLKVMVEGARQALGISQTSPDLLQNGTQNTALAYHDRRLLALVESSLPYHVRVSDDGDFHTVGPYDFGGALRHAFTAHPKVDARTGEMFLFGYDTLRAPHMTYSYVNKEGALVRSVPIPLAEPIMAHDMAITKNYAVLLDLPLVFRKERMVMGKTAFVFDEKKKARFGVLPRYAEDTKELRWFETDPCFIFHVANAWEEGDEIVMFACRLTKIDLDEVVFSDEKDNVPRMHEFRFNLRDGSTRSAPVSDHIAEFPRIHPNLNGYPSRYVWCATGEGMSTGFSGVSKYDLVDRKVVATARWGPDRTGGEPIFVPCAAHADRKHDGVGEDEGYIVNFVYDRSDDHSEFVVLDAKTLDPQPIASARLPQRVPAGFHGLWLTQHDIANQR